MKGFTLIELLAVIVILAIILIIAMPIIANVIENSKKESFIITAKELNKAAEFGYATSMIDGATSNVLITFTNYAMSKTDPNFKFEFNGKAPKEGIVFVSSDGLIGVALTDGKYCVIKNPGETEYTTRTLAEGESCVPLPPSSTYAGMYIADPAKGYINDEGTVVLVDLDTSNPYQFGDYVIAYKVSNPEYPNVYYLKYTGSNPETEFGDMYDFADAYYGTPNPLAFDTGIKQVYLEEGITKVSSYAFYDNNINVLSLPNTLTRTDEGSFSYNQISQIVIPNNLAVIGPRTFWSNGMLSVTMSDGVIRIENEAFDSNNLTEVTIPHSVTTIEYDAFRNNKIPQGSFLIDNTSGSVTIDASALELNGPSSNTTITPTYLR